VGADDPDDINAHIERQQWVLICVFHNLMCKHAAQHNLRPFATTNTLVIRMGAHRQTEMKDMSPVELVARQLLSCIRRSEGLPLEDITPKSITSRMIGGVQP